MKITDGEYSINIEAPRWANIGQQWEFHVSITRKLSKYEEERISLFLDENHCFLTIYINRFEASGIVHLSAQQVSDLMDNSLSLAETMEYCRKNFCSDLTKMKKQPKRKRKPKTDNRFALQLGLFA